MRAVMLGSSCDRSSDGEATGDSEQGGKVEGRVHLNLQFGGELRVGVASSPPDIHHLRDHRRRVKYRLSMHSMANGHGLWDIAL